MKIFKDISLRKYNTFGLDYKSENLIEIDSEDDIISLSKSKRLIDNNVFILGGGSNLLFTDDFTGTLIHSGIDGIMIERKKDDNVIVSAGSGVNWDKLVDWCVNNGYWGLENLSLIPGNVGASPIQNIGAYGEEVKSTIEKVRAISLIDGEKREFTNEECRFDYRDSVFKNELKDKYFVSKVYFKLSTVPIVNLKYGSLAEVVDSIGNRTLKNIRDAVIKIRRSKLPDPELIGNAGSFFKNPVVDKTIATELGQRYNNIPLYEDVSGGIKIAAGWMIDKCGWKGKRIGDAGVHEKQALVLVNHGNATGKDIFLLSESIKKSVFKEFGIKLEREVKIIGTI